MKAGLRTGKPISDPEVKETAMKLRNICIYLFLAALPFVSVPAVASARTAEETSAAPNRQSFQLRLVGTAVADDPNDSVAVIESGVDGRQRSYREGERAGDILIIEILRDRVIVDTQQGEDFISLSHPLPAQPGQSGAGRAPAPAGFGTRPPENRRQQTLYLDGKTLTAELADLDDLIQEVDVDPVNIYGKPVGVRIFPIEPDSIFAEIGLKTGDVIKEINGMQITRPEQAIAVFQQLKAGEDVDIKVKGRRTRQIHLIID